MTDFSAFEVGPGTRGGRYLRTFWHPVSRSADLPRERALPIRVLGENYTLYRGENGGVHIVDALCPHRGTKLSVGWVEGDDIRCLYHGWKFDAHGQCIERPGENPRLAARMKVGVYPAQEYLGLIFGYFGDGAPPALPHFPEFDQEGVLEADPPERWPCHFLNRMDNDLAHLAWTHRGTMRRFNRFVTFAPGDGQDYIETEFGLVDERRVSKALVMPYMGAIRVSVFDERWKGLVQNRLMFMVPTDDENMVAYDITFVPGLTGSVARDYLTWREQKLKGFTDDKLEEHARSVLSGKTTLRDLPETLSREESFAIEDYVTQVGQGHPKDRPPENLGRNDSQVILFRKIWTREVEKLESGEPLKQWSTDHIWDSYKQHELSGADKGARN